MAEEAFVTFVHVHVVEGGQGAFLAASRLNAENSRREPGVTRFDVLQEIEDPRRFVLVEGYVSDDAVSAHRRTDHYAAWRAAVDDLMAEPRHATRYVTP